MNRSMMSVLFVVALSLLATAAKAKTDHSAKVHKADLCKVKAADLAVGHTAHLPSKANATDSTAANATGTTKANAADLTKVKAVDSTEAIAADSTKANAANLTEANLDVEDDDFCNDNITFDYEVQQLANITNNTDPPPNRVSSRYLTYVARYAAVTRCNAVSPCASSHNVETFFLAIQMKLQPYRDTPYYDQTQKEKVTREMLTAACVVTYKPPPGSSAAEN